MAWKIADSQEGKEEGDGKILLIGAISEALTNIKCGCKLCKEEEEEEEDKAQSIRTQREEERKRVQDKANTLLPAGNGCASVWRW